MGQKLKWQDDPCVRLGDAIFPLLWHTQDLVLGAVDCPNQQTPDFSIYSDAVTMLRKTSREMLKQRNVPIAIDVLEPLERAAGAITDLLSDLRAAFSGPVTLAQARVITTKTTRHIAPLLEEAMIAYRTAYLGFVLDRQDKQAKLSAEAIAGLDKISKQIFFISINASVEAARAGDAGRGFTQISSDIRALSQSAQNATKEMRQTFQQPSPN